MISSGWRTKRKVIKNRNIIIYKDNYLESPDVQTIFTMIDMSKMKQKVIDVVSIYQQIKISDCTNYDFNDCNIYIEGLDKDPTTFTIKDSIRNCLFFNCTIISEYENNIQFRYCVMKNVKFDIHIEKLDFSSCVLNCIKIGRGFKDPKYNPVVIADELSFNDALDDRAVLSIGSLEICGRVNWIWIHNPDNTFIKKFKIDSDKCTDIACLDGQFIFNMINYKNIIVSNNDFSIHDYEEERGI